MGKLTARQTTVILIWYYQPVRVTLSFYTAPASCIKGNFFSNTIGSRGTVTFWRHDTNYLKLIRIIKSCSLSPIYSCNSSPMAVLYAYSFCQHCCFHGAQSVTVATFREPNLAPLPLLGGNIAQAFQLFQLIWSWNQAENKFSAT